MTALKNASEQHSRHCSAAACTSARIYTRLDTANLVVSVFVRPDELRIKALGA